MLTVTFLPAESFITSYRQGNQGAISAHKVTKRTACAVAKL
jgi:hypothetical protein